MKLVDRFSPFQRRLILLGADIIAIVVSFLLACFIQYPAAKFGPIIHAHLWMFPLIIVLRVGLYFYTGAYDFIWRYASIKELGNVVKAALLGTLVLTSFTFFSRWSHLSGRVLFLDFLINVVLVGANRISLRVYRDYLVQLQTDKSAQINILIIGAGDAGEMVLREIRRRGSSYNVVGFIDDSPAKVGKMIHQKPVLGVTSELSEIARHHEIAEVIIAIPSAPGTTIRRILDECESADVKYKITPSLGDIISGQVSVNQTRNVNIEDLLGREVVEADLSSVVAYLSNAKVLVTGAGGSIGSELCRQILGFSPEQIILVDHAETALYHIDMELRNMGSVRTVIVPQVADVKSELRMAQLFDRYRPDVVFHAAAYKHVPLMEQNVEEVILNNVVGTRNVLEISARFNVKEFVLISTDKAVRAANSMGATKRLCEVLLQYASVQYPQTKFTAVRFGNVLGSQGSVVPLFKKQIEAGGPITVTHPEMTRYFMTIPEAVRLVIQAGALAQGGEIFILDMGEPVRIANLARDLIMLSGLKENDIEIVYTGLRPGEKLHEELVFDKSVLAETRHKQIFVVRSLDTQNHEIRADIDALVAMCYSRSSMDIHRQLLMLANSTHSKLV
ncbi:polysaccharide biosynthesis protein [bacterium]|nr:polysaccharide biosynthesis protein [bacterium]